MLRNGIAAFLLIAACGAAIVQAQTAPAASEQRLFAFDSPDAAKAWTALDDPKSKVKEPAAKTEYDAAGKGAMKITFDGGEWPAVVTTQLPEVPWEKFSAIKLAVRTPRACVVELRLYNDQSIRGYDKENEFQSRFEKTVFLKEGENIAIVPFELPRKTPGRPTSMEIAMLRPHKSESIAVESIALSTEQLPKEESPKSFTVLGTTLEAKSCIDLARQLEGQWKKPEPHTLDEVETAFKAKFDELKKTHPTAAMAILRDGEKGWDAANPDKAYNGWKDAYVWSHPPDAQAYKRATNFGKVASVEMMERWRSQMMQVDLSVIPKGSEILAAQMVLIRGGKIGPAKDPSKTPNMWVAEACNRPWEEYEVNAYEYAKEKYWKTIAGQDWSGDDPDFLPIFLAFGASQGMVNTWDFTAAVKYWTDGKHENHGFFWYSDQKDYWTNSPTRETEKIKDRPAMMVIWVPAEK